ncbi:hypothetical protein QCE63_19675 [Caballeronia sp. LZ065]|uniref:hypothetical protein n=1 Tax=Caballeronia sp. LZ065 TaxID=3038571 RepID=UPI00285C0A39|nr:hypothetical protein [Caballeronia sp. LZ065]MDR5781623.1 hypothetical protein [Caballeronia sp. LZ065]
MLSPTLTPPGFDFVRANVETCLRLTLTMNDALRQFSELNRKTIDTALAGEAYQSPLLARWPSHALNYATEAFETLHATAADVMATLIAPTTTDHARIVYDVSDTADAPRPNVILDAQGEVVKRLTP